MHGYITDLVIKENFMPNAVIYARQSSGSDDFSLSVEQQILNCRALAQKENYNIVGIFQDLNTSGETYPAGAEQIASVDNAFMDWLRNQSKTRGFRAGLGNLLTRCPGGTVNLLLVNEITRLYRPVVGSFLEIYINNFLRQNQIKIIQVQGGSIDLTRFDEHLINMIKNQILFEDLQKKRANSIAGIRARKDAGKLATMPRMFGIEYLGHDKYHIAPEKARIIRFIFESVIHRDSYNSISKKANVMLDGIHFFWRNDISRIIRQPLYCGLQYNSKGELIPNLEMQGREIVSFDTWRRANKIVDEKKANNSIRLIKKHWLPLSGRMICGSCGDHLLCSSYGRDSTLYYSCLRANTSPHPEVCRKSRIRFIGTPERPGLMEIVYPFLLVGLYKRYFEIKELHDIAREIAANREKYAELMNRETELLKMFSTGKITKSQYDEAVDLIRPKRQELHLKILESTCLHDDKKHYRINNIWHQFKALRDRKLTQDDYEDYVEAAELRIIVWETMIRIHTFAFDVDLPRIRIKNHHWLPHCSIHSSAQYGRDFTLAKPVIVKIVTGSQTNLAEYKNIHFLGVMSEDDL